ncbi:MAG: hypothetical protein H0W25_19400 [Acidimicrobiia bacterium]|nr:hypothetical protein [Acidimicrobiia bacterium]
MPATSPPDRVRGVAIGLIAILGIGASLVVGLMAFVLLPEVGLFGDANTGSERFIGVLCALLTGQALLAGVHATGLARRDRMVVLMGAIAGLLVTAVVALLAI